MAASFASKLFAPNLFASALFGAVEEPSASSGIRRLQLYKLQEEALVKDAVKKAVVKLEAVSSKPKIEVVATEKPRKRAARRLTTTHKVPELKPLVLAPVKTLPTVYDELAKLPPLVVDQIFWALSPNTRIISIDKERHRRRKKVAALLLLAA